MDRSPRRWIPWKASVSGPWPGGSWGCSIGHHQVLVQALKDSLATVEDDYKSSSTFVEHRRCFAHPGSLKLDFASWGSHRTVFFEAGLRLSWTLESKISKIKIEKYRQIVIYKQSFTEYVDRYCKCDSRKINSSKYDGKFLKCDQFWVLTEFLDLVEKFC